MESGEFIVKSEPLPSLLGERQKILLLSRLIPLVEPINENWNLITRTILPVVSQPGISDPHSD